jgi:hypothetical protein
LGDDAATETRGISTAALPTFGQGRFDRLGDAMVVVVVGVVVVVDVGTVVVVEVGMVVVVVEVVDVVVDVGEVAVAGAGATAMSRPAMIVTPVSPRGSARRSQERGVVVTASMYRVPFEKPRPLLRYRQDWGDAEKFVSLRICNNSDH